MYELQKAIKLQRCSRTFEIAHYVFALLRYEEREEISPICLVVVPLKARLLLILRFDLRWQLKVKSHVHRDKFFSNLQNFFVSFSFPSAEFWQIICDCCSD